MSTPAFTGWQMVKGPPMGSHYIIRVKDLHPECFHCARRL